MYNKLLDTLYQYAQEHLVPHFLRRYQYDYLSSQKMEAQALERLKGLLDAEGLKQFELYTEHRDEAESLEGEAGFLSGLVIGLALHPPMGWL